MRKPTAPVAAVLAAGLLAVAGLLAPAAPAAAATVTLAAHIAAPADTAVMTFKNDIERDGDFSNEPTLNESNVNVTQFGKRVQYSVDGQVYAEPLFLPNLSINGGTHNARRAYHRAFTYLAPGATGPDGRPLTLRTFLQLAHTMDGIGGPVTGFSVALAPSGVVLTLYRVKYGPYHAHLRMTRTHRGWAIASLDRI